LASCPYDGTPEVIRATSPLLGNLRGTKSSSGPTKGGVSLTRDDGINFGFDYDATRSLDLSAGYSRSVYGGFNTFSFGIGVNVAVLLRKQPVQ
jgi:hypothetical protein